MELQLNSVCDYYPAFPEAIDEIRDNISSLFENLSAVCLPPKSECLLLDTKVCIGYIAEFFSQKLDVDSRDIALAIEGQPKDYLDNLYNLAIHESVRIGFISAFIDIDNNRMTRLAKDSVLFVAQELNESISQDLKADLMDNFGNITLSRSVGDRNILRLNSEEVNSFGIIGRLEKIIGLENATAIINNFIKPSTRTVLQLKKMIAIEFGKLNSDGEMIALAQKLGLTKISELVDFLLVNVETNYINILDEDQKSLVTKVKMALLDKIILKQARYISESTLKSDIDKRSNHYKDFSLDQIMVVARQKLSEKKLSFSDVANIVCEHLKISQEDNLINNNAILKKKLLDIMIYLFAIDKNNLSAIQMSNLQNIWKDRANQE